MSTTPTPAPEVIWECKIGGPVPGTMPDGWDFLMRHAVKDAFHLVAGVDAEFTFSGRGQLTEMERAVVEKRAPTPAASRAATLPADTTAADFGSWLLGTALGQVITEYDMGRWWQAYCAECEASEAAQPASPAPLTDDGSTPGPWRVEKRERDGELAACWIAAPDCNGFAYAAEILGDDEYRDGDEAKAKGMPRLVADCELIVKAVAAHRAALASPQVALEEKS